MGVLPSKVTPSSSCATSYIISTQLPPRLCAIISCLVQLSPLFGACLPSHPCRSSAQFLFGTVLHPANHSFKPFLFVFYSSFRLALLNRRTSEHCYIYTYMSYILYFTPCHFTFTTLYTYAPSSQFPPALALSPQFVSPPRLASLPFLLVLISSARASPCPSYMSKYCFFVTAVALEICAFAFPSGP